MKWLINGVDTARWRLQRGNGWRTPITVRRDTIEAPGRHGNLEAWRPNVYAEPVVPLELVSVVPFDEDVALEDLTNELLGILTAPTLTLTRISGGIQASARARLVSLTPGEYFAGRLARYTAVLAVPGVFFRGPEGDSVPVALTSTPKVVDLANLTGSTGPIADAVVRVAGPLTSVTVGDDSTGTGLSWTGSLPVGQYLYLHAEQAVARRSASSTAWGPEDGTDVSGGLDYPVAGRLALQPVPTTEATPTGGVTVTPTSTEGVYTLTGSIRPEGRAGIFIIGGDTQNRDPSIGTRSVSLSARATGATSATQLVVRARKAYL